MPKLKNINNYIEET